MLGNIFASARAVGGAIVTVGLVVACAIQVDSAGSAGPVDSASAALTSSAVTTTAPAPVETRSAIKYRWGAVVAGDEFNYTGRPNSTKWSLYNSAGHGGKGLRRPAAWKVDGGAATVTGDPAGTTGGMSSRFSQKYGRWEARMKTNKRDSQYHPNLMLWPNASTGRCSEVDFAESTDDVTRIKFFLHYGCRPDQTRAAKVIDMTQWHNYAVEWTSTGMKGFIDGELFFIDTDTSHLPPSTMHASMQLDWFPKAGMTTQQSSMSVDWIRIYKAS